MNHQGVTIGIFHDTRRPKRNGKYPVKLRVFSAHPRKQKLYPLGIDFTAEEFRNAWESKRPKKEYKEEHEILLAALAKANEAAKTLTVFDFEDFERLLGQSGSKTERDVGYYYQKAISSYKRNKQLGTASSYELSLKSLLAFSNRQRLSFIEITTQWLQDYERYMLEERGLSRTTVGVYLRPLRAIFNTAIAEKEINAAIYPFGKRKYVIPSPRGTKRALNKDQLRKLFNANPKSSDQQKAKDFWFFSYSCNGMNMKDILNLRFGNIRGDYLFFRRAKTANTNKSQAPVTIYLSDHSKMVIKKYGSGPGKPNDYVFPVLQDAQTAAEQRRILQNFTRFVNQHFLSFAKSKGILEPISLQWARHSFSTKLIRDGGSMEALSEALSHSNLNTTKAYFAGFEDEHKKQITESIMNFE